VSPSKIEDEFSVIQLRHYRRRSWIRRILNGLDIIDELPRELLFGGGMTLIFAAFVIRALWSTTEEFRGLVLTTVGWAAGLAVAGLVAWKLAPAVWRYIQDRYDHYQDRGGDE
jgi:hypothetical protein